MGVVIFEVVRGCDDSAVVFVCLFFRQYGGIYLCCCCRQGTHFNLDGEWVIRLVTVTSGIRELVQPVSRITPPF